MRTPAQQANFDQLLAAARAQKLTPVEAKAMALAVDSASRSVRMFVEITGQTTLSAQAVIGMLHALHHDYLDLAVDLEGEF